MSDLLPSVDSVQHLRAQTNKLFLSLFYKQVEAKSRPKQTNEEVMIHQKTLQLLQNIQNNKENESMYIPTYQRLVLEICTLIQNGVSDPFELMLSNKFGWKSVLFNEHVEKERRDILNLTRPLEVEEGIYQCLKCGSKKTHHYSRQVRSADEPMTTFITCANKDCQHKWKIN